MSQTETLGQPWCVYYGSDGKLKYRSDNEGNRVPDYSYAGYRYGVEQLPEVPEVLRIGPRPDEDNTQYIQNALDEVARQLNTSGSRGALVLEPGSYEIRGTLHIKQSGVVLRGAGDGEKPDEDANPDEDTILVATGNKRNEQPVVILGTKKSEPWDWDKEIGTLIVDDFVQVGSLSFNVEDVSLFEAGDPIIIKHPSTPQWIEKLDGGGVIKNKENFKREWQESEIDILYYRRVVRVEGSTLYLDAPVYNHLNRALSQSITYTTVKDSSNFLTHVGIESLRIEIESDGDDEDRFWDGVGVCGAEDSWVRDITIRHFYRYGVYTKGALRITVTDTKVIDPVGTKNKGGYLYNFNTEPHSQLILFQNCEARNGRHNFISNGKSSTSGIVFHRCKSHSSTIQSESEGHKHWTQAMLFDNIDESSSDKHKLGKVLLFNRGNAGGGKDGKSPHHGWSAAHSTIWNYNGLIYVQKPPTAQNYAVVFSKEQVKPKGDDNESPLGHVEFIEGEFSPASLYEAQLNERLQR